MTKVLVPERSRCFLPSLTALFLALGLAFTGVLSSHGPGPWPLRPTRTA